MSDQQDRGPSSPDPASRGGEQPPTWSGYPEQAAAGPYGTSPYGSPGAGWPVPGAYPPREHPQATTAMVLGIVGLAGTFICGILVVLGPFAWYVGAKARREIDAQPGVYSGRGQALAGMILGIVTTVLLVLAVVGIILVVVLVAGSASSSGS